MKKIFILFIACLGLACSVFSQQIPAQDNPAITTVGSILSVSKTTRGLALHTTRGMVEIMAYSPSVIRVRMSKNTFETDFSYAVIAAQLPVKTVLNETDRLINFSTDSLKITIQKNPYAIAFYTATGQLINEDEPGLTTSWAGQSVTTYKKLQPDEHFIGLGEKTGNLDRTGSGFTNWNSDVYGYSTNADPLYSSIPFYIGLHTGLCYGIFLDNTWQSDFNFGASNNRFSSFGARGGEMNYYFIHHARVADLIKSYTWLTGRMPLPPLWSLGYQQNRYSYYPQTEVMRIAHTLREKRIPADGITLDIHYMNRYQLFTWNKNRFPQPVQMTQELNKLGFKLTVIVDPGIKVEKGAPAYESGLNKDVYLKYTDGNAYTGQVWPGWCNFTDFTAQKGRSWWQNQVKFFAAAGVSGIWNDMNEISTWGQKMPDNVLFNYDGNESNHLKAHNVYGLEMARASYEGAKEHFAERPFVLTRSGYAGLQRYTAIWTGDNRAEDDHMLQGVRLLTSLGLSGVSFSGMDIGGFTGNPSAALYTRWIELGAFIPYFRNHTAFNTKAAEPWTFGEDVLDIARRYISLRYQLLPYIYSNFYESTQSGLPVMRSLVIDYTLDKKVLWSPYQNEYLFGSSLLVAPFESNRDAGKLYLPEGSWYDLYSDNLIEGKQELLIPLSLEKLPVYVKAGSILPMQSLVQSTSDKPTDTLLMHIYKGNTSSTFNYYEDDGKSFRYEQGNYYKRQISFTPANKSINFAPVTGAYKSNFKFIKLVLHGFGENKVLSGGRSVSLTNSTFNYLGAPDSDLQQSDSAGVCVVKTLVINNDATPIQINY